MSVLVQNSTGYDGETSASSHTFAHDSSGGGSNLAIVVGCGTYTSGGREVTGITYDGDALAQIETLNNGDEGADIYARANINTGASLNVVITLNGSANIGGFALTAQNVDQTTPKSASATSTVGAQPSITLTTAAGELVIDLWEKWANSGTPTAGQTQIYQGTTSDTAVGASYKEASGVSTTMSWTGVGSSSAHVAMALKEAAGGGPELSGSSAFSGFGSLISSGIKSALVGSALQGLGAVVSVGTKTAVSGSAIEGSGELNPVTAKGGIGGASLSGSGTISTTGTTTESHSGSVVIGGSGVLETSGSKAAGQVASINGVGTIPTVGTKAATSSVALSGLGSISVAGLRSGIETGLIFPSNPDVTDGETVRFKFTNPHSNGLPIYGASGAGVTYIWRVKPVQQTGYYTTMFWANDDGAGDISTFIWDGGGANTYYGAHPYPPGGASGTTHEWEISVEAIDVTNGTVVKDEWYIQAFRAWGDVGENKHHEFYWDLPNVDSGHKVTRTSPTDWANTNPPSPALTFGDAPWQPGKEMLSGTLRGLQIYNTLLTEQEILDEIAEPLSTVNGAASIWYLNLNPTPTDISDKSGNGNHPEWVGANRPTLYSSVIASTSLSGSGAPSTSGTKAAADGAILGGAGVLTTSGAKTASGDVEVNGAGSLATSGTTTESHSGSASISGAGVLAVSGAKASAGVASLTGVGDLAALGLKSSGGSIAISGRGGLSAGVSKQASGATSLSGSGVLSGSGTSGESHNGTVAVGGAGVLASAGTKAGIASTDLTASGQLAAMGLKQIGGTVSLSGGGIPSNAGNKSVEGFLVLSGWGSLSSYGASVLLGNVLRRTNEALQVPSIQSESLAQPTITNEALIES